MVQDSRRNNSHIFRLDIVPHTTMFRGRFEVDPIDASWALSSLAKNRETSKAILIIIKARTLSLSQAYDIALQLKQCRAAGYVIFGIATTLDLSILLALSYCNYRFAPPLAGVIEFQVKFRHIHLGNLLDELRVLGIAFQTSNLKPSASTFDKDLPDYIQQNEKHVANAIYEKVSEIIFEAIGNDIEKRLELQNYLITSGIEAADVGLITGIAYPEFINNILIKELNLLSQPVFRRISISAKRSSFTLFTFSHFEMLEIDDLVINNPNHLTATLIKMSQSKSLQGILFIINCHGGDLNVADKVWLIIREISRKIPTVAYIEQATSAGYYLASAANKICMNPCGITGSLGTMLVRLDFSNLLNGLGISFSIVNSGQGAVINPSTNTPSQEELEVIKHRAEIAKVLFLERVNVTRKLDKKNLAYVSNGCLLDSEYALSVGLVDKICDFTESIDVLKSMSKTGSQFLWRRKTNRNLFKSLALQFLGLWNNVR